MRCTLIQLRTRFTGSLVFAAGLLFFSMVQPLIAQGPPADYDDFYPNHARGQVNNAFDANGFDNVNLYNGNLTINLPLGPPLHPGGDATLQIALRYNSSIWADEDRCSGYFAGIECDQFGQGALLGTRSAGLGWSLDFGRIARKESDEVFFVTPDGGEHQFFPSRFGTYDLGGSALCDSGHVGEVCYSRDGSDLKVERTASGWEVSFPSGVKTFYEEFLSQYSHTVPTERDFVGRDFARTRDGWYCTRIEDRWGHHIDIDYTRVNYDEAYAHGDGDDDNSDPYGNVMTQLIPSEVKEFRADGTPQRYVTFVTERPADVRGQRRPKRITAVTFHRPNGTEFLRYELSFDDYDHVEQLQLQAFDDFGDDPVDPAPEIAKLTDWVYLLDEVSVYGSDVSYGFSYWTCAEGDDYEVGPSCPLGTRSEETFTISSEDPNPRHQGQRRGVIRQARLPTGGVVNFDFDVWSFLHHTTDGTPINQPPECDIDNGGAAARVSLELCALSYTYQLGVTSRSVSDADGVLTRTAYHHASDSALSLPVRFDAGNPAAWNPEPGYRDDAYGNDLRQYRTSYATTVVTNDFIVDGNGGSTEIGTNTRSDDSVYYFSLGTTVIDHRITDGGIQLGEGFTLPLTGALVFEQHYRGDRESGDVERSVVHTYTVDDDGDGWSIDGPRYGSQLNRRPREVITYFHGAAPEAADLVSVSRYGYENDLCSDGSDEPCPNVASGVSSAEAFASHRTDISEQTDFTVWNQGFSKDTMFDPLDTAVFDRTTRRTYWKDAITAGDWLLNRLENQLSNVDGVAESELDLEYGATRGELLEQRLFADPGGVPTNDDVVTTFVYVNNTSDSGHGQVRRRRVGLAGGATPEVSEFIDYSHGVANRTWTLCEGEDQDIGAGGPPAAAGRCEGWAVPSSPPALAGLGLKAELSGEKTIDDGWRHPTAVFDANGNGVGLIEHDAIGRPTRIVPTSPSLAETWIDYTAMSETEVSVETASGQPHVVSHVENDGLGRTVLEAKRRVGTASTAYAGHESDFHHKTSRHDGRGTSWRQSDWRASADHGTGDAGAVVVKTVDPWGRTEKALASDGSRTEIAYSGTWRTDARVFDAGGATPLSRTVTDFDARGNAVRVLEDKNTTTLNENLATPSSTDFVISEHTFDAGDRLTEVAVTGRDAVGARRTQLRSFAYDPRGFLVEESFPELGPGSISYCLHDASGRPGRSALGATFAQCSSASPSNDVVDTFSDAGGRPLQSWAKQGGGWYLMSEAEYGDDSLEYSVGRPVRSDQYNTVVWPTPAADPTLHIDPQSIRVRHLFTYSGPQGLLGRRVTEVAFGGTGSGGVQTFELGYSYDLWGNLALVQYPRLDDMNSCIPAHDVRYTFDTMGLVGIHEELKGDFTADLLTEPAFNPENGMMTGWSTASGIDASSTVRHTIIPDGTRLRVKRIIAETEATPTTTFFDSGTYTYDGRGNVEAIAGSAFTAGWNYSYDALSRLVSATSATTRNFTFDDLGNLTAAGGQSTAVDPATNRLSATGTSYDSRGNLTHQPVAPNWTRRMRFDAFNRLVAAWSEGASAPADTYVFAYDHAGERVLRYRVEEDTVQEATFSLRDEAGNVLSELLWTPEEEGSDTGGWTRLVDTVYLGRRPIVQTSTTAGGARQYTTLVTDHLDSVRAEVYDADPGGTSSSSIDYWPFGEIVSHPTTLKTHHLFTAHERDFTGSATGVNTLEGVDYMHARYYNLDPGRFLSVDPVGGSVGRSQSWNRYAYVLNSPLNFVDPSGAAYLDPNSTEDEIRWIGDRKDEVIVVADDPAPTVSEIKAARLRIAGGGATTEEVPWDAAVQNASISAGGSVPLGAVKKVGETTVPIPARLTGSISLSMEGINLNLAVSPGASTASGYIVLTETMTFGEAMPNPSGSIDYQGGTGLFGGGEVATDLRSYVSVTGKFGLGFGHSGGLGKDLSFPILDDLAVVSFK